MHTVRRRKNLIHLQCTVGSFGVSDYLLYHEN